MFHIYKKILKPHIMLINPILAILRGIEEKHVPRLAKSFINASIDTVEITMNTPNAPDLIRKMIHTSENRLTVGAGTVLTLKDLDMALNAGSKFIVTPVVNTEVIKACVQKGIQVFPGALTPTEVWEAWNAGATMVKVFPASMFGPTYFKELRGPFNNIKLMAVGGVKPDNINEYFSCGAQAVAIGGSIFSKERLDKDNYSEIENDLFELVKIYLTRHGNRL
jgi:2-dehydro-3-deoxyphosphogluconate aldolase/(4S)-4-hydroxy-2-oxoglutarate aldolase